MKLLTCSLLLSCFTALIVSTNARNIKNEITDLNLVSIPDQNPYGTNVDLVCTSSVFHFSANVGYLTEECVESSKIKLNDVWWDVKLCKEYSEDEKIDLVFVYLESFPIGNWSCIAEASFKITASDGKSLMIRMPQQKYTNLNSSHGIELALWEIFQNYIIQKRVYFTIEIFTKQSNVEASDIQQIRIFTKRSNVEASDIQQIRTKLHLKLENATQLIAIDSSKVIVRDIHWNIHLENYNNSLGVYLQADENDLESSCYYKVNATFKLLSFDSEQKPFIKEFSEKYQWGAPIRGFDYFINWHDFVNASKKYVVKDKASFLIQMEVSEPKALWDELTDEIR